MVWIRRKLSSKERVCDQFVCIKSRQSPSDLFRYDLIWFDLLLSHQLYSIGTMGPGKIFACRIAHILFTSIWKWHPIICITCQCGIVIITNFHYFLFVTPSFTAFAREKITGENKVILFCLMKMHILMSFRQMRILIILNLDKKLASEREKARMTLNAQIAWTHANKQSHPI